MTLLELLVQELPKRGGWPQWAAAAVQGDWRGEERISFAGQKYDLRHDGEMWSSSGHCGTWGENSNSHSDFTTSTLASDHATRIVTREEYERAAAIKASEDLVKAAIRRLTDAVTVQIDKLETGGSSVPRRPIIKETKGDQLVWRGVRENGYPAGWFNCRCTPSLTPLQRIEQLRKARDEAVRAYNDAFVSGETELRKLKLGDKVITNSEVARHDRLVLKLVKIAQFGDGRKDRYVCDFVDEKGNNYDIDNLSTVRFAPI